MIRYNLQELSKITKDDCDKILRYFYHVLRGTRMDKTSKKIHNSKDKFSFMTNEEDLLLNSINASKQEICIYIYLAGFRNYLDYIEYGQLWLPIEHSPFDINKLRHNRLIKLTDEKIILKYEKVV